MLHDVIQWCNDARQRKSRSRNEPLVHGQQSEFEHFLIKRGIAESPAFRGYFENYSGMSFVINPQRDEVRFLASCERITVYLTGQFRAIPFATKTRSHAMYVLREDGVVFATA